MNRQMFKATAKKQLKQHYLPWLVIALISILLAYNQSQSNSEMIQTGLTIDFHFRWLTLFELIFTIGFARVALDLSLGYYHSFKESFLSNRQWLKEFGAMLLVNIYTILWTFLFIIPGVMKYYAYSMVPYILAEDSEMSISDAIALSQDLTDGFKFDLFILDMSFILWDILAMFTLGISGFYSEPYKKASFTQAYLFLSR